MKAIMGTVRNGQIISDQPVEWPEGCRVTIKPAVKEESLGIREEDWPTTPEALAEWLAWFDSLEPVELTLAEEADLKAWRQRVKEYTIANMDKDIEGLFP